MIEEEKQALEEKQGEGGAPEPTELEKKLAVQDELLVKLAAERDNYKKGMLKAKGKLKDDITDEEETVEDKVDRLVKEALLDTQFTDAQRQKDQLIKDALARNKELETALKNRSQISPAEAGSGSDSKFVVKDNVLSEEKLKQLKAMKWDDKKIELYKQNLMKQI